MLTGSGAHHWFRRCETELRNSAGKLGDGLGDVRGDGGYVVAPPSVHANGNRYAWMRPLEDATDAPGKPATERRNGTTAAKLDEIIPEGGARRDAPGRRQLKRAGLSGDEILPPFAS